MKKAEPEKYKAMLKKKRDRYLSKSFKKKQAQQTKNTAEAFKEAQDKIASLKQELTEMKRKFDFETGAY